ncbi:hypothetical protein MO973_16435 [Paenibacillus sp. TRM 82003]|uniref:hypothetical protein n=1 Tax=Kineococcus sp. TRM81007 TaxID=2925831 RepID=UPI001F5A3E45|nr:hypothetical protein [Kineococcus sp. TRM81007]MCI2237608.1 hypothetical protein [Kineococcus sp. TRM81007]MCI3921820.1 hypothetical protein [Paenibacillus sp. TRM 82003]
MTDEDLTDEQRSWQPADSVEAVAQWPNASKVENWSGVLVFYAPEEWDWRSVALAARTYPGRRVELADAGQLTVDLR